MDERVIEKWERRDSGDDESDEVAVPAPLTRAELKSMLLRDRAAKEMKK